MSKKKIIWIVILIVLAIAIITGIVMARPKEETSTDVTNTTSFNKNASSTSDEESQQTSNIQENKQYQKTELEDGVLYSVDGQQVKADIVVGDNYFDTTISDIYLNPDNYYGKNIEIEGMYLLNQTYTFVGRYSISNLCPYCPAGYSYMEYQLDGTIDQELINEQDWIKVIGTLQKGNDETSNYQDYYYLKVSNFEIMNEKGQDTVKN